MGFYSAKFEPNYIYTKAPRRPPGGCLVHYTMPTAPRLAYSFYIWPLAFDYGLWSLAPLAARAAHSCPACELMHISEMPANWAIQRSSLHNTPYGNMRGKPPSCPRFRRLEKIGRSNLRFKAITLPGKVFIPFSVFWSSQGQILTNESKKSAYSTRRDSHRPFLVHSRLERPFPSPFFQKRRISGVFLNLA